MTQADTLSEQAHLLYAESRRTLFAATDRLFAMLFLVQWLAAIVLALAVSPYTWSGTSSSIHPHVWAAIFLGGLIAVPPAIFSITHAGTRWPRYVNSVAQMLASALLIDITGGRIETHFHIFGSLAILSFYRDWTVLVPATLVTAADHFLRGRLDPQGVYGVAFTSYWRAFEHAGWVVFEDLFLVIACVRSSKEMRQIAEHTAELQESRRTIEAASQDVTIFALAKLAESRDADTGHHIERVQAYCRALAEEMRAREFWPEVDDTFVQLLFQTSPLHDIGKVGIPDAILQKPGKLTRDEFEIMKTHTTRGADTLEAACRQRPGVPYLEMARDIARSHHERWDGTGYPQGLSGTEIPLCARVVALADVYDALMTKRAYKEAYNHAEARSIIVESAGTHFDPQIVDVFLSIQRQFLEIHSNFSGYCEFPMAA